MTIQEIKKVGKTYGISTVQEMAEYLGVNRSNIYGALKHPKQYRNVYAKLEKFLIECPKCNGKGVTKMAGLTFRCVCTL